MDFIKEQTIENRVNKIINIIHMDIKWEEKIKILESQVNLKNSQYIGYNRRIMIDILTSYTEEDNMKGKNSRNFWFITGIVFLVASITSFINKSDSAWLTLLVSMIDFFIAYRENEKIKEEAKAEEETKMQARAEKKAQNRGKKKKKTKKRK